MIRQVAIAQEPVLGEAMTMEPVCMKARNICSILFKDSGELMFVAVVVAAGVLEVGCEELTVNGGDVVKLLLL